ncbi:helix-turn-helix transcriptional regulator [Peterkaempfera griseoplana]|uniref:helix-turn-helix transcriptional regulator n=1 Tax=Peterkaempfera griseoplana TaxID=66896 RepID=UPI0006E38A00|nr:helix-turn-helix transcriptional regulator [Peterkaempfera griseoplana]
MSDSGPSLPLRVAVLAEDRLTAQTVEARLTADDRVHVLPADAQGTPDILLVITAELGERTLAVLKRCRPRESAEAPRPVPAPDEPTAGQLVRVVGLELAALTHRELTTLADITALLCSVADSAAPPPQPSLGSPQEQMRTRRRDDRSIGTDDGPSSFTARELAVLRQLAAGLSTLEIAAALHYSERTVKYIIHEMIVRHRLRNRVHAVAHALRQGLL